MSPLLFNVVLEDIIMRNKTFTKAAEEGTVVAFADDILLLLADNLAEAKEMITSIGALAKNGLVLNPKTKFISEWREMKEVNEIEGI